MPSPIQRDHGLDRIARATRWMTASAFAFAGIFTVALAKTIPGKSAAPSAGSTTTPTPAATDGSSSDDQASNLAPPVQAPVRTRAPAAVSSGGS